MVICSDLGRIMFPRQYCPEYSCRIFLVLRLWVQEQLVSWLNSKNGKKKKRASLPGTISFIWPTNLLKGAFSNRISVLPRSMSSLIGGDESQRPFVRFKPQRV